MKSFLFVLVCVLVSGCASTKVSKVEFDQYVARQKEINSLTEQDMAEIEKLFNDNIGPRIVNLEGLEPRVQAIENSTPIFEPAESINLNEIYGEE